MDEIETLPPKGQELRPDEAWVHLLPLGETRARDGRVFRIADPAAVIRASMLGADLPVDYEHELDEPPAGRRGPVPAAGWISELEAREGGIFGRVRWTDEAGRMVAARQYRYLSPVVYMTPEGEVRRIRGASLVHHPALELLALSSERPSPELACIALAAGLERDADAEAIVAFCREAAAAREARGAAAEAAPDPARYVPAEVVRELLRERADHAAWRSEAEAEARVATAMDQGYLTPAMRPWAVALCRQDPAAFEGFLTSAAPAYAHLARKVRYAPPPGSPEARHAAAGDAEAAICRQLGLERLA